MKRVFCLILLSLLMACTGKIEIVNEKDQESLVIHQSYLLFRDFPSEIVKPRDVELWLPEELKPFIDSRFKTKSDRSNTLIAGSSMGGLISAYAICEYPDVFGAAACLSTHWPPLNGVFLEYIRENLPDPSTHKIYFDYGTIELDAAYEPFQLQADSLMEARGFEKEVNWITRRCEGEGHNSTAWHKRFHIPMEFLLSGK